MSFSRYLTQKYLEAALEEIVMDLDNNDEIRKHYSFFRIFIFYICNNVIFRYLRMYAKNNLKYLFTEHIDAVYVPPSLDSLTEEDMNDESNLKCCIISCFGDPENLQIFILTLHVCSNKIILYSKFTGFLILRGERLSYLQQYCKDDGDTVGRMMEIHVTTVLL